MSLDTEGELVQSFTVKGSLHSAWGIAIRLQLLLGLVESFATPWSEAVAEWVYSCSLDDQSTFPVTSELA